MYNKIGVVVADKMEFEPLRKHFSENGGRQIKVFSRDAVAFHLNSTDFVAVFCGIGKVNAAAITAKLIADGCDCIMNYGLSGGLGDSVVGKFSVPDRFVEHDFDLTALGYKPCEKPFQEYIYNSARSVTDTILSVLPDAVVGTAVCGDRFITEKKDRDFFIEQFGAKTCDMETAAIASVCNMADVPFYCLRRVSDGADENVQSYTEMNINSGDILFDSFYMIMNSIS